jgi:hypothetical protein
MCSNNASILLTSVEAPLLEAISQTVLDAEVRGTLASTYHEQMVSWWNDRTGYAQAIADTKDRLLERRLDLTRKADSIADALQDDGRNPLMMQRLKIIQEELSAIDADFQIAAKLRRRRVSGASQREFAFYSTFFDVEEPGEALVWLSSEASCFKAKFTPHDPTGGLSNEIQPSVQRL